MEALTEHKALVSVLALAVLSLLTFAFVEITYDTVVEALISVEESGLPLIYNQLFILISIQIYINSIEKKPNQT
jgi:hypothetical protein